MNKMKNLGLVLLALVTIAAAVGGMVLVKQVFNADDDAATSEPVQVETVTEEPTEKPAGLAAEDIQAASEDPSATESAEEALLAEQVERVLASMTLEEKIGQMFVVDTSALGGSSSSTTVTQKMEDRLEEYPVGGIVLQSGNISYDSQVSVFIQQLQACADMTMFMVAEEESGDASVLASNAEMNMTTYSNLREYGDNSDLEGAAEAAEGTAQEMLALGFNMNMAPMIDVITNDDNDFLTDRSFGTNAEVASLLTAAQVEAYQNAGISACAKYFPGSGGADADPADGYAETTRTLAEMEASEWHTYAAAIESGVDCIMLSNIAAPSLTGDETPCSLSDTVVSLLRNTLGYDGIIISGSLSEKAITNHYSSSEAVLAAVEAGVDIIYMPTNLDGSFAAVESAVKNGTISLDRIEESVKRILAVKISRGLINPEDYPALATPEPEYDYDYYDYDYDDSWSSYEDEDYDDSWDSDDTYDEESYDEGSYEEDSYEESSDESDSASGGAEDSSADEGSSDSGSAEDTDSGVDSGTSGTGDGESGSEDAGGE